MLHELRIENLLLIERAELRLGPGLNAITGETGAGKTILAHSLDLLLGGKARPQIVRPGAAEAYVEGVFAVPDGLASEPGLRELAERLPGFGEGDEAPEEIVLARRIAGGSRRTSAFVQGRAASAADLRLLGSRLLAFYGQHEHRRLTLTAAQMEILDGFAGPEHLSLLRDYRDAHAEVGSLTSELEELREREGARERDLDLLRYELSEIETAAPDPGEAAELSAERERLRHSEGLRESAAEALLALSGDADGVGAAAGRLAEAEGALSRTSHLDRGLGAIGERVAALSVEAGEVAGELRSYLDGIDAEPGRLDQVEERLDVLDRLERKHGGSIESVLAHAERCRAEIERLETSAERGAELEHRLAAASERRESLGDELRSSREGAARRLEQRVEAELAALAMEGARLEVGLEPHPERFGPGGTEVVELRVATNAGMPAAPLAEAASGGELSRIMLALCGVGPDAGARTLAFDEIDAGIGGNTARAVGERLRAQAAERQVICITHLPQVASLASTHFRIEKRAGDGGAVALCERVDGEDLVAEICRMLGAEHGDQAASRHARELLAAA